MTCTERVPNNVKSPKSDNNTCQCFPSCATVKMCAKRLRTDQEILDYMLSIPEDVSECEETDSSEDEYIPQDIDNSSSSDSENDDIQHDARPVQQQQIEDRPSSSAVQNEPGKCFLNVCVILIILPEREREKERERENVCIIIIRISEM